MKKLITIKGELNEINTTSGMLMAEAKRLDFSLNKYISKVLDDHVESLISTKKYIIISSQQRELLIDFSMKTHGNLLWGWKKEDSEKLVDEYQKGNL